MTDDAIDFELSTGNVFEDLGLPDADERLMKAQISRQIALILQRGRFTQAQAAELMGISQPKVSAILRGRLSGFSVERLIVLLMRLGKDVQLVVMPKPRSRPTGTFSVTTGARSRSSVRAKASRPRKAVAE
ncbi:MAG: helix-turn-helix domain-containing protein [Candidatus Sericytochromatia bacterium]